MMSAEVEGMIIGVVSNKITLIEYSPLDSAESVTCQVNSESILYDKLPVPSHLILPGVSLIVILNGEDIVQINMVIDGELTEHLGQIQSMNKVKTLITYGAEKSIEIDTKNLKDEAGNPVKTNAKLVGTFVKVIETKGLVLETILVDSVTKVKPDKKLRIKNNSDILQGVLQKVSLNHVKVYFKDTEECRRLKISSVFYGNGEQANRNDLKIGEHCNYNKKENTITLKRLKSPIQETRMKFSEFWTFGEIPEHLAQSYIDNCSSSLKKSSLKISLAILECLVRTQSETLKQSLIFYVNENEDYFDFIEDLDLIMKNEMFPHNELVNLLTSKSDKFIALFSFNLKDPENMQKVADNFYIGIKIDYLAIDSCSNALFLPACPSTEHIPLIHMILFRKSVLIVYSSDHLEVDGFDLVNLCPEYNRKIPDIRLPFYYLPSNSGLLDAIEAMTNELLNNLYGTPPNYDNILSQLSSVRLYDQNRVLRMMEMISYFRNVQNFGCLICQQSQELIQVCKNECRVCQNCLMVLFKGGNCNCGSLDLSFIDNARQSLWKNCMLCNSHVQGVNAVFLKCGCYLCFNCSYECLMNYYEYAESKCPYCYEPLLEVSFDFNYIHHPKLTN